MPSIPWPVRYGFGLAVCLVIAAFPWAMTMLYSPLPPDLRLTATALSATRTAREMPLSTAEQAMLSDAQTVHITPTMTHTSTPTYTASPTMTPTIFYTPTRTFTPIPEVSGIANETVNAYACPGKANRQGKLETGSMFVVLGWDEMLELDETVTYILIENDLDKPQKWIKDSEYVLLSVPDYKAFIPRLACRK